MKDNSLNCIVKVCSEINGVQQRDFYFPWEKQVTGKAEGITSQSSYVLSSEFTLMTSGWRYSLSSAEGSVYTLTL